MHHLLDRFRRDRTAAKIEPPLRDDILGADRLEDRALALAARFTIDPRARARSILPRFHDNTRVAGAGLPDPGADRARRAVRHRGLRMAARQLPPRHVGDRGQSAATCPAPTTGSCRHWHRASTSGGRAIYAMAVELVRHSDSRIDQPAARSVSQQLPARRAADDRRAVGVAEHAEARAHREPPAPGRRDAASPRSARRWPTRSSNGSRPTRAASRGPPGADIAADRPAAARARASTAATVADPAARAARRTSTRAR